MDLKTVTLVIFFLSLTVCYGASNRPRRAVAPPQDQQTFTLNSLMTSMLDRAKARQNTVNSVMQSLLNGTAQPPILGASLHPLFMEDSDILDMDDDGELEDLFDDGPFEDLFDDDGPFDDGIGMIPPGLVISKSGEALPPLAPKIRIDGGGASLMRDRYNAGSTATPAACMNVCLTLTVTLIINKMVFL